jgi:DNA polymerase-3 subunit gamma/tau
MSDSAAPITHYRVLARKYRPRHFGELIGQEALVRTLTNAINSGRIAHAYMLTGVRGVGKTTTARIIARALNYTGADGKAGPTTAPTDDCAICRAIAEDRHPDVIEMNAASTRGIDDIREILDGVRYAPTSARYKVYIIDEVHMLTKEAFNALLKTLEEPPPHVIFILATTEIRKVPTTILSRCQRFDLRRVDAATLRDYFGTICAKEDVKAEPEALALIGRAADGSVRDGLSLLDQAIALSDGTVALQQVQDMLGMADRGLVLDMLEHAVKGECPQALDIAEDLYRKGADPTLLMEDMLDLVHLMTRLKVAPGAQGLQAIAAPDMIERAKALAANLSMPALGRAWQLLLKGVAEVREAPNPQGAAEMILIRLAYAADLPDPADLLKKLKSGQAVSSSIAPAAAAAPALRQPEPVAIRRAVSGGGPVDRIDMGGQPDNAPQSMASPESLEEIVALAEAAKQMMLAAAIAYNVHLVKMEAGRLEIRLEPQAEPGLAQEIRKFLIQQTGSQWFVSISGAAGQPTLAQARSEQDKALAAEAEAHPFVREVLNTFPGAKLKIVKKPDSL